MKEDQITLLYVLVDDETSVLVDDETSVLVDYEISGLVDYEISGLVDDEIIVPAVTNLGADRTLVGLETGVQPSVTGQHVTPSEAPPTNPAHVSFTRGRGGGGAGSGGGRGRSTAAGRGSSRTLRGG